MYRNKRRKFVPRLPLCKIKTEVLPQSLYIRPRINDSIKNNSLHFDTQQLGISVYFKFNTENETKNTIVNSHFPLSHFCFIHSQNLHLPINNPLFVATYKQKSSLYFDMVNLYTILVIKNIKHSRSVSLAQHALVFARKINFRTV